MILINGNFLCRSLTGIERSALETCRRLDTLLGNSSLEVSLLVPANAKAVPEFDNITLVRTGPLRSFPRWDLLQFPAACRKMRATALNFSNTAPLGRACGYAFLHDIYAADFPGDFSGFRDRLIRAYSTLHYRNIARNARKILTVSEFSKGRIHEVLNVPESRIAVVPNGWDHFSTIEEDAGIFGKFPTLAERPFFFTLGSLQKRKNLKWILDYAKRHPGQNFAVSGKAIGGMESGEVSALSGLGNVSLLGYVSDGEVKALMKRCRAFVFPSYYEGFGIPPLEALSVGAKIVVAREASLPEIYGRAAHYIDAGNPDCDLEKILEEPTEPADGILERFTYRNSAERLLEALIED